MVLHIHSLQVLRWSIRAFCKLSPRLPPPAHPLTLSASPYHPHLSSLFPYSPISRKFGVYTERSEPSSKYWSFRLAVEHGFIDTTYPGDACLHPPGTDWAEGDTKGSSELAAVSNAQDQQGQQEDAPVSAESTRERASVEAGEPAELQEVRTVNPPDEGGGGLLEGRGGRGSSNEMTINFLVCMLLHEATVENTRSFSF